MSRVRLLFSEAWSSTTANISTTFAAIITVLISMFLLGLLLALGTWLISYSDHVKKGVEVKVYFASTATKVQEYEVGQRLRHDPRVKQAVYISKEKAFKTEQKKYPDLYAHVPSNPLPDTWSVQPNKAEDAPIIGKEIQRQVNAGSGLWSGVNDVKWGEETTKRVLTVAKWVSVTFLVAILLLVTASTLLIANTIRLSIFARRREIEVMKLVGATNWFVRLPFIIEGMLCGLVGAAVAIALLYASYVGLLRSWIQGSDLSSSQVQAISFWLLGALLLVAGTGLGAVGSGLTLRRYLRV
jgi:cell division transport system permease protein